MLRAALAVGAVLWSTLGGFPASADASEDAEETEEAELNFAHNGTYLQAGGSNAIEVFRDIAPFSGESAVGFNLRWGRRSTQRIAIEGQLEYLSNFRLKAPNGNTARFNWYTVSVNAKVFALTGRVQPYALLGMGVGIASGDKLGDIGFTGALADGSDIGFTGRVGAGGDLWITESLAASLEAGYVLPTGRIKDFDNVAVAWSLVYRFAIDAEDY